MKTFYIVVVYAVIQLSRQDVSADPSPGFVIGWGSNIGGEATGVPCGNAPNEPNNSTGVVMIAGQVLSNIVAASAGTGHSLALRSDGTVVGWGNNLSGEVAGAETDYLHSRTNGQVKIGGRNLDNVMAISAGCGFSLALLSNGTVATWGKGLAEKERSQIDVPGGLSNVVAIAAGCNYSMALKKDRTVVSWGVRPIPAGLSNVVAIAAGHDYHAPGLALKEDGTVIKWTTGGAREPVPAGLTNVVGIAAGSGHCLALKEDGTVVGWGGNQFGEATGVPTSGFPNSSSGTVTVDGKPLSNVRAVAAGDKFSLAIRRDGTLVAWGYNGFHQTDVPSWLSDVVAIAAGSGFCLAITTNGSAFRR